MREGLRSIIDKFLLLALASTNLLLLLILIVLPLLLQGYRV